MVGLAAVVKVMAICVLYYFLTFLLRYIFPPRAAHSKCAMIAVITVSISTLLNAESAFTVCMLKSGTHWDYFIILRLGAGRCGVIFELIAFETN